MSRFEKQQHEEITPKRAKDLLAINTFADQRPLKASRLDKIRGKIVGGTYHVATIAVAEMPDGTKHLLDGQHTLTVVKQERINVQANVHYWLAQDYKDLADIYREYSGMTPRSIGDIVRVELTLQGIPWPTKVATLLASALAYNSVNLNGITNEDRAEFLHLNRSAGDFVNSILTGGAGISGSRPMQKRPIVAAMIRTWQACHTDATVFWGNVRDGEMLKKQDPAYKLREFFHEYYAGRGRPPVCGPNGRIQRAPGDHEYLCRSIAAWNAFRDGLKLTRLPPYNPNAKPLSAK